jgi:hypothetical protein
MRISTLQPALIALTTILAGCVLTGCGTGAPERKSVTMATGDKVPVDKLTYNIVDTQILPHLGDEANPRVPQNRFYVVQLSVFNSGNADMPIPGMTLIDDSGKHYEELIDGTGVPRWLGVSRRVQPNQTEQGSIVFDAPAGHYKLRLTDDTDDSDVFVDIPLSFAHEQLQNETQSTSEAVSAAGGNSAPPAQVPGKKK